MSVEPIETPDDALGAGPYEVIHLGGETAAVVPLEDLRRLRALERRATAESLEDAEDDAAIDAHREWIAAGRPGATSHDEVMAELQARLRPQP